MRFLLSGASGFVGRYLTGFLEDHGHACIKLVRHTPKASNELQWDPSSGQLAPSTFDGIDVVINLSGASIAGRRWTPAYKQELIDSRVKPTALLATTMAKLAEPPAEFISFSGVGWYGHQPPGTTLTEGSPPGQGFIAEMAQHWEAAAQPAHEAGVRVIHSRLGSVMGKGSMLAGLVPVFRLGLGVRLGNGKQAFSWIALDDIGPALLHCIEHGLEGPVNFTAPEVVDNAQFTRALAAAVHRPALFSAPGPLLRLMLGELAAEMVNGQRVMPQRLLDSGYRFAFPRLDAALSQYVPQLLERR